jgi:hypothetical protein
MELSNFIFVDRFFRPLPKDHSKSDRFAIYCGETSLIDSSNNEVKVSLYVSAIPLITNANQSLASIQKNQLKIKNSNCVQTELLEISEIETLNKWGKNFDFKITDTRTSTLLYGWSGNIEGYYYWSNWKFVDGGETRLGAYMKFYLKSDEPQKLDL